MTMLNFTEGNARLAKLTMFSTNKTWVNLTVKHLQPNEASQLLTILGILNPEALAAIEDHQAIQVSSLKYTDGVYQRAYPISLHACQNSPTGLAIKLGNTVFPIATFGNLDVELSKVALSKYEDPSLVLTNEDENGDMIILPLPLRLTTEAYEAYSADETINLKKLQMLAKKQKFSELAKSLIEATSGGGSSSGNELVDIKTLPELEELPVTAVREVTTKFGKSFILTIRHNDTLVDIWAPNSVKPALTLGAKLAADSMLIYRSYITKANKARIEARLTNLVVPEDNDTNSFMDLFV